MPTLSLPRVAVAAAALITLALAPSAQAQTDAAPAPAAAASAASAPSTTEATLPAVRVRAARDGVTPSERSGAYTARSASTATQLDLTPRATPQSISVVTRAQIDDQSLRNANDRLSNVTGVNVERVETDRSYFSVRGFEASTGDQLGDIDTALVDRVEVLRGANGLMSSTGNPSATVNFAR